MIESVTLVNEGFGTSLLVSQDIGQNFLLDSMDFGAIQSGMQTYKFINQIGVFVTGVTLESRTATLVAWVIGKTQKELSERKRFLNKFFNPLYPLTIIYEDYRITGIPETSIQYGAKYEESNDVMCKFMVSFFCADPMFYNKDKTTLAIAEWIPQFHFPLEIPEDTGIIMGLRTPSSIFEAKNDGVAECGAVFIFTAQGTVVNPEVVLINKQQLIRLNMTMEAGDTVRVSTVENNKTVTRIRGNVEENAFNLLDFGNSTFFSLEVGSNFIRYGAESGSENLLLNIEYEPRYLEVQE